MTTQTAFLVIDMQVGMFTLLSPPLHRGEALVTTIADLLQSARQAGIPVIYIQHNTGTDIDGTTDWQFHAALTPQPNDIIIQKYTTDSFAGTSLDDTLKQMGISDIVVVGVQTEHCITNTCIHGVQLGYHVALVQEGHSTNDTSERSAIETIALQEETLRQSHVEPISAAALRQKWASQTSVPQ